MSSGGRYLQNTGDNNIKLQKTKYSNQKKMEKTGLLPLSEEERALLLAGKVIDTDYSVESQPFARYCSTLYIFLYNILFSEKCVLSSYHFTIPMFRDTIHINM